jgi:hypothetical protein
MRTWMIQSADRGLLSLPTQQILNIRIKQIVEMCFPISSYSMSRERVMWRDASTHWNLSNIPRAPYTPSSSPSHDQKCSFAVLTR